MRDLIRRRLHGDESGVTLVIVALCLIALFGMLVLVVDVGGLLLNRREMVNASDAAALAAAKSCVLPASKDPLSPEQAADEYAANNSARAQTVGANITAISGCDTASSGYVTVQYGANQHLFFAPVLGAGSDRSVTTTATAVWGPSGAANPLPLVVYANAFNSCKLDTDPVPGVQCAIWEDNSSTGGSQSGFGFLDLRTDNPSKHGWDSVAGAQCDNPGSDIKNWIDNYPSPDVGDLPVNYPDPTYVCLATGGKASAFGNDAQKDGPLYDLIDDDDIADNNDDEDVLYLPLNRCDPELPGASFGQINSGGGEVSCPFTPHQYDIIGFVAVKLKQIYTPNEAAGGGGSCNSDVLIGQGSINLVPFDISTLTANNGSTCPTSLPDQITSGPTVTKTPGGKGPDPVGCAAVPSAGCDYSYLNGFLTWDRSGPAEEGQDFRISFGWRMAGPCGIPPAGNNSGHCILVEVVERRLGGSLSNGGSPDGNLDAIKLCESTIAGSCNPVVVP